MIASLWAICILLVLLPIPISTRQRPNIVLLIADDLGIGDVGCFGNDTIRTPRIDQMAGEGIKLTQHLAGASHCTPSRAALLTGRYPIRSGMAPSDGVFAFFYTIASTAGLPTNETTIAEIAKSVGYTTALFGKWHLGLHEEVYGDYKHSPTNQGFDYFFGLPYSIIKDFGPDGTKIMTLIFPHGRHTIVSVVTMIAMSLFFLHKHNFIPSKLFTLILAIIMCSPLIYCYFIVSYMKISNSVLLRNTEVVEQPIILQNLTQRLVQDSINFIEMRKQDEVPFMMVMSFVHVHTYIDTNPRFTGKSKHGTYGDAIEELDWAVGEILDALDKTGMGNNTVVYFTSDNGGHLEEKGSSGEQEGGWNGIYKGGKLHGAVDGAIRVPTVVRWPDRVPGGIITDEPTSFLDILPTVTRIMGATIPQDRIIDGKDMTPLLSGEESLTRHRFMVHYCGEAIHAVRYRPPTSSTVWKLVYSKPAYIENTHRCITQCGCSDVIHLEKPELHNMTSDPREQNPISYTGNKNLNRVVDHMIAQTEKHKRSIKPVPTQYTLSKLMWRPSLQPCCGGTFPFCSCQEDHGLEF